MARARKPAPGQSPVPAGRGGNPSSAGAGDLPHSAEAEISVLGSMILNNETIDVIAPLVGPDDFAATSHRVVFESILYLHEHQRAVDFVTLQEELKRRGQLDAVGGLPYISSLIEAVPAAANAEHYAQIVREKAINRSLLLASREIADSVARGDTASRELLDHAQARIFEIAEKGTSGSVHTFHDILKSAFDIIDRGQEGMLTGLETGFKDLDEYTSGLQNGELIIIAGRPSMGKTTFALNLMEHVGVQLRLSAALFSLEMSKEQVARNMLCAFARVEGHRVRRGRLSHDDRQKLAHGAGAMTEAPIFIDDSPALNCFDIRAKVRRLKDQKDLRLVIVDYLQLVEGPPVESRQQQIGAISRSLKGLAREMNIPVIAIAQLNRSAELRDDHKPRMADLRESGSLEQDADVVMLLHRQAYYSPETQESDEARKAECIIAKQRNGPTGTIKLTFLREIMRFEPSTEGAGFE